MYMAEERSANGTADFTESHTAAAVWLFLPIRESGCFFKAVFFLPCFYPAKEKNYEMSILQQSRYKGNRLQRHR